MRLGSRTQSIAAAATTYGYRPAASFAASASASASASAAAAAPTQQQPPSASLTEQQRDQLAAFLDHLLKTNETMNLTAVRDRDEAWTRHVEDSLALLPVLERWASPAPPGNAGSGKKKHQQQQRQMRQKKNKPEAWFEEEEGQQQPQEEQQQGGATAAPPPPPLRLIDVGTGPGLPGMILAIARPHWRVTLLDSLRKRCDFLKGAATMLGLANVDVVWSRAEDAGRSPQLRDAHDAAVARAVAETRVLTELCLPFVRPGGVFVAAKGAAIDGEVEAAAKAIAALRGRLAAVEEVESFYGSGAGPGAPASASAAVSGGEEAKAAAAAAHAASLRRTAIVVEKVGATPAAYPRPPGTPNKKPL
jgi:16S rRNA (guanine(527)-N(7))-methyltransferase RsmG